MIFLCVAFLIIIVVILSYSDEAYQRMLSNMTEQERKEFEKEHIDEGW